MSPSLVVTLNRGDKQTKSSTFSDVSVVPIPPENPLLYQLRTAGQVGISSLGSPTQPCLGTFKEQAQTAFENVAVCLALAGATPHDIVKITIFIVDYKPQLRSELIDIITSFFSIDGHQHTPPSTLIGVAALASPEFLIEVEAEAVVKAQA